MTFNEAINELKAGRRVRCRNWHPTYFIELGECPTDVKPFIYSYSNNIDSGVIFYIAGNPSFKPCFSLDDIAAEWDYYTDPICKNKIVQRGARWPKELTD